MRPVKFVVDVPNWEILLARMWPWMYGNRNAVTSVATMTCVFVENGYS